MFIYILLSFALRDEITWNKKKSCRAQSFPWGLTKHCLLFINYSYLSNWPLCSLGWSSNTGKSASLKRLHTPKLLDVFPYWIYLSLFATKVIFTKEKIASLSAIIWLLGIYIRFPSIMNNSIEAKKEKRKEEVEKREKERKEVKKRKRKKRKEKK